METSTPARKNAGLQRERNTSLSVNYRLNSCLISCLLLNVMMTCSRLESQRSVWSVKDTEFKLLKTSPLPSRSKSEGPVAERWFRLPGAIASPKGFMVHIAFKGIRLVWGI